MRSRGCACAHAEYWSWGTAPPILQARGSGGCGGSGDGGCAAAAYGARVAGRGEIARELGRRYQGALRRVAPAVGVGDRGDHRPHRARRAGVHRALGLGAALRLDGERLQPDELGSGRDRAHRERGALLLHELPPLARPGSEIHRESAARQRGRISVCGSAEGAAEGRAGRRSRCPGLRGAAAGEFPARAGFQGCAVVPACPPSPHHAARPDRGVHRVRRDDRQQAAIVQLRVAEVLLEGRRQVEAPGPLGQRLGEASRRVWRQ
mmetsp:Transcript_61571/g.200941  ORF Transcript_61571/g.200941 Transcript_61571/m.200941 type:complete len:264 (-) Transcript_61571:532-1323(-)